MIFLIPVPLSYSEAADPNEQSKLTQGGNQENHDKQAVGQYVDTQYQQPPVPQHEGYQFQPPTEPQHPGYHFQPSSGPQDPGYKYQTPPIGAQFPSCQYQPISGNAGQQPMTVVVTNLFIGIIFYQINYAVKIFLATTQKTTATLDKRPVLFHPNDFSYIFVPE